MAWLLFAAEVCALPAGAQAAYLFLMWVMTIVGAFSVVHAVLDDTPPDRSTSAGGALLFSIVHLAAAAHTVKHLAPGHILRAASDVDMSSTN